MLNLIGWGGGDAIAAESSADSSLMSVMKLDPVPFLAYLTGDVALLVFRSDPIAFFSREVSWTATPSLPETLDESTDVRSKVILCSAEPPFNKTSAAVLDSFNVLLSPLTSSLSSNAFLSLFSLLFEARGSVSKIALLDIGLLEEFPNWFGISMVSTVLEGGTVGSKIDTSTLWRLLLKSPKDLAFSRLSSEVTRPFFSRNLIAFSEETLVFVLARVWWLGCVLSEVFSSFTVFNAASSCLTGLT